ncbi:MAG: hypothetical protein V1772_00985 [Chloroflexota bacterium]
MRAVFVRQETVLRDSRLDPRELPGPWRLAPATVEAMRLLATDDRLVFIYGAHANPPGGAGDDGPSLTTLELVKQLEAGGGRVDGLALCPHAPGAECSCWADEAGLLWSVARQFDLKLEDSFLLGDSPQDVVMASAAGVRPMTILCQRSIAEVFGDAPAHKDAPIALDLTTAVSYIGLEEEIGAQLGRPRLAETPARPATLRAARPEAMPRIAALSRLARGRQAAVTKARVQMRDVTRWLSFFTVGAVGLSLGIAYLLTHLYRVQPFPEFAYYVTLQFIPRPLRGALFVAWGAGIIFLALRSFLRSTGRWGGAAPS